MHLQISCCECFRKTPVTPVRVYLRKYFAQLIGSRRVQKKTGRRKVKPVYSGEALTSDEIFERLEEEDRLRAEKATKKKQGQECVQ